MFRLLAIMSALCVVLFVGYLAMDRGVDTSEVVNKAAALGKHVKPKVDAAADMAREALRSAIENAEAPTDNNAASLPEENLEELFEGSNAEFELPKEDRQGPAEKPVFDRQWETLEETQGLLSDTGEMLNK